jgi:hypothetical protein
MKKLIFIPVILLLVSCGMSPEEKAIADYEQTIFDSKIDLSFDPIRTEIINPITALDSFKLYQNFYDSSFNAHLNERELVIQDVKGYLADFTKKRDESPASLRHIYQKTVDDYIERLKGLEERYEKAKSNPDEYFKDEWLEKKNKFQSLGEDVIGYRVRCQYKIRNPLLDVTQEVTNDYILNPDKSKILGKISATKF